jgi:hypothetical protein
VTSRHEEVPTENIIERATAIMSHFALELDILIMVLQRAKKRSCEKDRYTGEECE